MLDNMSAEARGKVEPFIKRWESFSTKLWNRAEEVTIEAEAGLEELTGMNPLDSNVISGGFSAVESRYLGLSDKVEQAVEKLEGEWDEVMDDADLEDEDDSIAGQLWTGILNQSRKLQLSIEKRKLTVTTKKYADWARKLYPLAEEECSQSRSCTSCGAAIIVDIKHVCIDYECPFCNSINEILMGEATGYYYQGNGVHSLAQEAAFEKQLAEMDAENAYHFYRHPTDTDRENYTNVARAHWRAYYEELAKVNPGFSKTVEQAVEERLKHYEFGDISSDREVTERAMFGSFLKLVRTGDKAKINELFDNFDEFDIDDAIVLVHEHGDRDGARLVLSVKYEREEEDEDYDEWLLEQMKELDRDLADR